LTDKTTDPGDATAKTISTGEPADFLKHGANNCRLTGIRRPGGRIEQIALAGVVRREHLGDNE
jgi:hypothetical protein